ncbi:MAG: hypothetical protein CUN56_17220, partial [Phototrophicales bacterium]
MRTSYAQIAGAADVVLIRTKVSLRYTYPLDLFPLIIRIGKFPLEVDGVRIREDVAKHLGVGGDAVGYTAKIGIVIVIR